MLNITFDEIPTFEDKYADVRQKYHFSGVRIVEVEYGATDKEGNPTYPKNNADGHGRLIAVELDGAFHVLAWKHSRAEGGATEEGSVFNDKEYLKDLEEDVNRKRDIIRNAREIMSDKTYDTEEADKILAQFDSVPDHNTPKEAEYKEQYARLKERNDRNKQYFARTKENADKKSAILEQARELKGSEDWNATGDKFKELSDEWKKLGNAGAENDKLWEEFSEIKKDFFDRRKKHFDELDQKRKNSVQVKKNLIREARQIAGLSVDYNGAHKKLEELFTQWKEAGPSGKEDSALWTEFKSIRDDFYERRNEAYRDHIQDKEALIKEAESLADGEDYSTYVSNRMKDLNTEWKDIGPCGGKESELWNRFHAAQDKFWQGKKAANASRLKERQEKLSDAIERRNERINGIKENNKKLRDRLNTATEEKKAQIEGWIAENEEKIRQIEEEIARMDPEKPKAEKAEKVQAEVTEAVETAVTEETVEEAVTEVTEEAQAEEAVEVTETSEAEEVADAAETIETVESEETAAEVTDETVASEDSDNE